MQEHERALGGWQAEWLALPQFFLLASGAASHLAEIAKGLDVDPVRMRANLDATNGLIMSEAVQMALAGKIGRLEAHDLSTAATNTAESEAPISRKCLAKCPR